MDKQYHRFFQSVFYASALFAGRNEYKICHAKKERERISDRKSKTIDDSVFVRNAGIDAGHVLSGG